MYKILFILFFYFICSINILAQEVVKVTDLKEMMNDLSASTKSRKDGNDKECALIKVMYPYPGVTFEGSVIGDTEYKGTEYWVYVPAGTKRIKLHIQGQPTIVVEFAKYNIPSVESKVTYNLEFLLPTGKHKFIRNNSVYMGVGGTYSSAIGVSFLVGGTFKNINAEVGYTMGFGNSKEVAWYSKSSDALAETDTYKLNTFFAKLGYQIAIAKNFGLIPQVGYMAQILKSSGQRGDGAVCGNVSLGIKVLVPVAKNFRFFVAPEYAVPVQKSETYTNIAKIAGLNEGGFYATAGLMVNF